MMIGRALAAPKATDWKPGAARLSVAKLTLPASEPFGVTLRALDLTLRAGDVLGVAGVAGNGQEELVAVLSGVTRTAPQAIRLEGAPIGGLGPQARRARCLAGPAEERRSYAAAPDK